MTRTVELATRPEPMTVTVERTALIVVDTQNGFGLTSNSCASR